MAEVKAFVPYRAPTEPEPPNPYFQNQWFPPPVPQQMAPIPPPNFMGKGKDLLCATCQEPIELGEDHPVLNSCVAVRSKMDPSAVVSENHQETKDISFCSYVCLFHHLVDDMVMGGDTTPIDDLVQQYFGGAGVIPCRCSNCGNDVDSEGIIVFCDHCDPDTRDEG